MIAKKDYRQIQDQLQGFLAGQLDGVSVQVGDDIHYRGTNIVVTSPRFAGLLPQQRFYFVMRAIPADFYEKHLHGGCVWFELAPGETGRDLMKMPRSEDVAGEDEAIRARLEEIGFFEKLGAAIRSAKAGAAHDSFAIARRVLGKLGMGEEEMTRACLFFMLHGAYVDAQILTAVLGEAEDDEEDDE
jgi:hypothetical protein